MPGTPRCRTCRRFKAKPENTDVYGRKLVITFRPEFEPPWSGYPHLTLHTLNNLGREESCLIVDRVAGGKTLPTAVMEQILENTDGVPLYVEELTKTVLDSDLLVEAGNAYVLSAQLPSLEIPASLQNSLTERLDRLGPAKIVAQMAAAIGRSFGHELLAQISQLREQALSDALSQLNEAGMIHRHGRPPDVRYDFKHVLVQEAAYHSLLKGKRQEYHLRIAEVLETSFPDTVETEPETLAFHYAEAGRPDPAVTYWQRAGEQAVRRSACLVSTAEQNWSTGAA